jgi:hypothetical protein
MSIPIVDNALKVITEGIKYLTLLQKTSPIRKMKKAIDAGEKYIQLDKREGPFRDISDKQRASLMKHYCKIFFNNNQ